MAEGKDTRVFYDSTVSLCSSCLRRVDAKIVFQNAQVFLLKRCPGHGSERVLLADDVAYYRRCREDFIKPPQPPGRRATAARYGCPYDCGLCPEHEQHSCLSVVEICGHCDLRCPICYAESGPGSFRDLAVVERMLDAVVASEGEPDIVQLSGGEPTSHPDFFQILDAAKRRPIKHLMLNTNGVRIARDADFVRRLAGYKPGIEVYLQFDSFEEKALRALRGADLRGVRTDALKRLNTADISTSLVVTLKKGLNDDELGKIISYALRQSCVRRVVFQPVQAAGRLEGYDPARDRLTLSEVRRRILEQSALLRPEDITPVPCHPDSLAMAYAIRDGDTIRPLSEFVDPSALIRKGGNTIAYENDSALRERLWELFSTGNSPRSWPAKLKDVLCCLPGKARAAAPNYREIFSVVIMQFMDAYSFDARSVKRACVHITHPDGRIIPFDTYNLFYRDRHTKAAPPPYRAAGPKSPPRIS